MRAWVLAAVLGVAAGCARELAGGSTDGAAVFAAACATCHGPAGRPSEAMVRSLGVRDLTAPEFRARVTVELVRHQVHAGSQNKKMPAFAGALTDAQIAAVARFVTELPSPR